MAPQNIPISKSLQPVNVTLYGKKIRKQTNKKTQKNGRGRNFADVIQLRILRRGDNPRLSKWALNAIISVLKRKMQREIDHR